MSETRFEWDETKDALNQRKHGVSFVQASQVFSDPLHLSFPDRVQEGEQRWQSFGVVKGISLLLVAHTVRGEGEFGSVIRIISARRANRQERQLYEEENG